MTWTYTMLIGMNLVFIILCGTMFSLGATAMGFAMLVCGVLIFLATLTAYLGNHIPLD